MFKPATRDASAPPSLMISLVPSLMPSKNLAHFACISFLLLAATITQMSNVQAKDTGKNSTQHATKHHQQTGQNQQAQPQQASKPVNKLTTPVENSADDSAAESTFALFDPRNQVVVDPDRPDALTMAAKQLANTAQISPADKLLEQGRHHLVRKDYAAACKAFQQAQALGSVNANAMLGNLYLNGFINSNIAASDENVAPNDAIALDLFSKAAEQGDADGQIGLGILYSEGRAVAQDDSLAIQWFALAAKQDNADAQRRLGLMYQAGRGVEADPVTAAAWFREAALKNEPLAQVALGDSFREADGVERDDIEAAWWFEKAAEQGNPQAQVNLGMMYADGRGVHQDDHAAFKWFYQAAKQGNAVGLYRLGVSYAEGLGTDINNAEAIRWLKKAADLGDEQAQNYLQQLGFL